MKITVRLLLCLCTAYLCGLPIAIRPALAVDSTADGQAADQFIRVAREESGRQIALQTSIISFERANPESAVVDLVSAVHIGEVSYFAELNRLFKTYDAVLYELVAPKDIASSVSLQDRSNPLSSLQRGLTETLGLDFQLDRIDYAAKNFVHADLSPEEFLTSMKERGESGISIAVRILAASLEQKKRENPLDSFLMLGMLFETDTKKKALGLKRILAEQTQDMETLITALNGKEGSTLITARNERALRVLREQLKLGKKRIAIYYGAAHMNDFAADLATKEGFTRGQTRWLDAWNLRD